MSIQVTIIPSLTEFLGYDDPGQFVPQSQAFVGNTVALPIRAVLPLPHLRVRTVTTSATIWDGQTIAIGGLIAEEENKIKDKIPVLGDIPLVGRLFRSEASSSTKKNLMIFVTARILDPAGRPVHDPNNLPYDPNSVPSAAVSAR
jgi:general secretion pathway protein D